MRLSEFWALMEQEFGRGYAGVVASTQSLGSLSGRTAEQAIEDGERVRDVWDAVCRDMAVRPEHHRLLDPPGRGLG